MRVSAAQAVHMILRGPIGYFAASVRAKFVGRSPLSRDQVLAQAVYLSLFVLFDVHLYLNARQTAKNVTQPAACAVKASIRSFRPITDPRSRM